MKTNCYKYYYESPLGKLMIVADDEALKGLWFAEQRHFPDKLEIEVNSSETEPEIIIKTVNWLRRYFKGEKPEINELNLSPEGSEFRLKVWKILCEIPYGETISYGEIAGIIEKRYGIKKMSAQAVGGAVGHNPIGIIIPCHRVIGKDGSLTGYAGGIERKVKLLKLEGNVELIRNRYTNNGGKMSKIYILGWGPTADEVYFFINKYKLYEVAGFVQYKADITEKTHNGVAVYALEDLNEIIDSEQDYVFAAMFWDRLNDIRRILYEELKRRGYKIATLISPSADINNAVIGENCWIQDNVYIKPFAIIGDNTYLDTGSFVGLNSVVGKHCYIAGKALVAGFCNIGNQSFVGLNSTVFDHTEVGSLCVVGATTGVKRNIPDYSVVKICGDNTVVKTYEKEIMPDKLVAAHNIR